MHLLAVYVVSAARQEHAGKIGLRPTDRGFGTPAFLRLGKAVEVRVAGCLLVVESDGDARQLDLRNGDVSLVDAAAFAEVAIDPTIADRLDVPSPGDVAAPLGIVGHDADDLASWFRLGAAVLDEVRMRAPEGGSGAPPSQVQLWPEHFDLAFDLGDEAVGTRANVGFSPGDSFSDEPYLYVGPWARDRIDPTLNVNLDPAWNAPFGAVIRRGELGAVTTEADAGTAAREWIERMLGLLAITA